MINAFTRINKKEGKSVDSEDTVREKLKNMVFEYGLSICDEPQRCTALLKDLCPENRREVNLLLTTLRAGLVGELLRDSHSNPIELLYNRLTRKLVDEHGISEEAARWSVIVWANALGFKIEANTMEFSSPICSQVDKENNISKSTNPFNSDPSSQRNNTPIPPIINPDISSNSYPIQFNAHINATYSAGNQQHRISFGSEDVTRGLNWGGFVFPLFWGVSNRVKYAWFSLIPYAGVIISIIYLINGNKMAWNGDRHWSGPEEYKKVQAIWAKWALYVVIIIFMLYLILYLIFYFAILING
jgi:hypothetical protein